LEMNLTRLITMRLTTSDQQEVVQEKQIITTIRAFPEARGPVVNQTPVSPIQQVSGFEGAAVPGNLNTSPPVRIRAVRAVYPD